MLYVFILLIGMWEGVQRFLQFLMFGGGILIAASVVIAVFSVLIFESIDPKENSVLGLLQKHVKKMSITYLIVTFFAHALPNKDTLYLLAGVKVGTEIVNSQGVQEFAGDSLDVLKLSVKKLKTELESDTATKVIDQVQQFSDQAQAASEKALGLIPEPVKNLVVPTENK